MTQMPLGDADWAQAQVRGIGAAIRANRGGRSAKWISDKTEELGLRISRSTLTDIEIGRRKYVAVHELSLIAAALGVSPCDLLTRVEPPMDRIEFLPSQTASAQQVAKWWVGTVADPLRSSRKRRTTRDETLETPPLGDDTGGLAVDSQYRTQEQAAVRNLEAIISDVYGRVRRLEEKLGAPEDADG